MYLKSLSKDIAESKHIPFIDSARAVKDEIREDVKEILEKEYQKAKGKSWILKLKNFHVDSDFISDAITEWCFSYADKNRKLDKSYQIQTIAFSIMDSIISQDAVNRSKLTRKQLKDITSRKTRYKTMRCLELLTVPKTERASLGTVLINIALKSCINKGKIYVFELFKVRNSERIKFTDEFCDYIGSKDNDVAVNYFTKLPVYELENWTDFNTGGYKDKKIPLIKTNNPEKYAVQKIPKSILDAINTCQDVQFKIAPKTLEFIETIHRQNIKELSLYGTSVNEKDKNNKSVMGMTKSSWCYKASKGIKRYNKLVDEKSKKCINAYFCKLTIGDDLFHKLAECFFPELSVISAKYKYQLSDHYKRKKARLQDLNEKAGKYYQQELTTRIIDGIMADGNKPFKYVYTGDFRARMYANSSGLNPQGDKMSKNVIQFANSDKFGKDGLDALLYIVAGLYDDKLEDGCKLSKASKEERIKWGEDNFDMLVNIGNNPTVEIEHVKTAGEGLEFLNACIELAKIERWIRKGYEIEEYRPSFIARLDATCSGSQAMSILLKDLELAQSVNVAYTQGRVQDYYGKHVDIFEKRGKFPQYHGIVNRKHFKRAVMTYGYSVSERSGTEYIYDELKEFEEIKEDDFDKLKAELWQCVLVGAGATKKVMDWLQSCVKSMTKQLGEFEMCWPCPDGLICYDIRKKAKSKRVKTTLGNRVYQLRVKTAGKISNRKNITSVSPNVVHSIDKSVLMWTILNLKKRGCVNFAPIHDSIGVPLRYVFDVVECVNKAHLKLYDMDYLNVLKSFWEDRFKVKLPPIPKPEKVLKRDDITRANNPFS